MTDHAITTAPSRPDPSSVPASAPAGRTPTALLAANAASRPDAVAYVFHEDGLGETARITWRALRERSLALAARLAARAEPGSRVLLLMEPGLEVVAAAHACFAAGMVAVPVAPPNPRRRAEGLAALERVATDADVGVVFSTEPVVRALRPALDAAPILLRRPWLFADEPHSGVPSTVFADPEPTDLAYLQYTSGSTSTPRGVMLTHAQVIANVTAQRELWSLTADDTMYSWLPPWHDMGLISGLFTALPLGSTTHLAPPVAVARRPLTWLRAVSELGVTMTGGPDFMYRLVASRAAPEDVAALDLSRLSHAFCGSEPIRPATVRAFTRTFAPAGLRRSALRPCYGLAESTLLVCAGAAETPVIRSFDRAALGRGEAVRAADGAPMVGCGVPSATQPVAIVDPDTLRRVPDGRVGELWTRGPSNGIGYWRRPAATEELFGATIDGEGERWLATGDLAFFDEGELFVAGRIKDVVIVNGVNLHAPDIELVVQESDPRLATRAVAAFGVDDGEGERIAVVVEGPSTPLDDAAADAVLSSMRRAVAAAFDVMPHRLVLTASGALPKTTSGKVQRGRVRALLLADDLPVSREWTATPRTA